MFLLSLIMLIDMFIIYNISNYQNTRHIIINYIPNYFEFLLYCKIK